MRLRRGHLLAEALCALALAGLLAAVAAATLRVVQASTRRAEREDRGLRAEQESVAIIAQALRLGTAWTLRGDTAVELDVLLGSAVLCAREPLALIVPPAEQGVGAFTALALPLAADDLVALRIGPDDDSWWFAAVDSVQEQNASGRCDIAAGWQSAAAAPERVLRLVLADSTPGEAEPGAELRVLRRGRLALYHSGAGDWMLGFRRCHPFIELCGVIQPIAGPLRTPAAGGLRLRAVGDPGRIEIEARGVGSPGARATVHR